MWHAAFVALVIISGWASQYAEGVFERVIAVRQSGRTAMDLPAELPQVDGFVAVVECDQIGSIIYLRPEDTETWEAFLVVDCAGRSDRQSDTDPRSGRQWMLDNNILVEIDHQSALRWGCVGRGKRIEMTRTLQRRTYREWR